MSQSRSRQLGDDTLHRAPFEPFMTHSTGKLSFESTKLQESNSDTDMITLQCYKQPERECEEISFRDALDVQNTSLNPSLFASPMLPNESMSSPPSGYGILDIS